MDGRFVRFTDPPAVKARVAAAAWSEALRLHPNGVLVTPSKKGASEDEDEESDGDVLAA